MLTELKVTNFAIIDRVDVVFSDGFNVLSGETGSGKSVLLKSLALLMGDKSVSDTIKTGCEQATVEGAFDLAKRTDIKSRLLASGLAEALERDGQLTSSTNKSSSAKATSAADTVEDTLVVRRVISSDGKNRVYINGRLSTLQQLREIVAPLIEVTGHPAPLIEMTGQHENRNLQSKAYHLEMLDQYLGTTAACREVEELYEKCVLTRDEITDLESQTREKSQRLDFLTFQRDEICALKLTVGEEESLERDIRLARDSSKLQEFVNQAEQTLYSDDDSVLVRLHRIIQRGLDFSRLNPALEKEIDSLSQARTQIEEAMYNLRDWVRTSSLDNSQMDELEGRLSQLRKLQKKFGPTVSDILAELDKIETEIAGLEQSDERLESLRLELQTAISTLLKKARDLHSKRKKGAETFAKSVNAELSDLNMKGVVFGVEIQEIKFGDANGEMKPDAHIKSKKDSSASSNQSHAIPCSPTGISDIEFVIQSSKNDSRRALTKYASGGELSRILLSIKRVTGASEFPRTYLFDEVDAGVSGVTAEKVGRKLKSIAKGQQVICVTHLPQVAAFADSHFSIAKSQAKGGVSMRIDRLEKEDQVREIARMLSGEKITAASLANAKELLRN